MLAELSARHDVLQALRPHHRRRGACAGEDATRFATIGKLLGSRLQREVADVAVQFHGGIGYMDENWTSRYFRDTRLDSIGAGADEVMLRILARMDGYSTGVSTGAVKAAWRCAVLAAPDAEPPAMSCAHPGVRMLSYRPATLVVMVAGIVAGRRPDRRQRHLVRDAGARPGAHVDGQEQVIGTVHRNGHTRRACHRAAR